MAKVKVGKPRASEALGREPRVGACEGLQKTVVWFAKRAPARERVPGS